MRCDWPGSRGLLPQPPSPAPISDRHARETRRPQLRPSPPQKKKNTSFCPWQKGGSSSKGRPSGEDQNEKERNQAAKTHSTNQDGKHRLGQGLPAVWAVQNSLPTHSTSPPTPGPPPPPPWERLKHPPATGRPRRPAAPHRRGPPSPPLGSRPPRRQRDVLPPPPPLPPGQRRRRAPLVAPHPPPPPLSAPTRAPPPRAPTPRALLPRAS